MSEKESIVAHGGIGWLERDNKRRECGFCGTEIRPHEWHVTDYYYPEGQKRRKAIRVCMPCADVVRWAGEGGYEENGLVDPWTADTWAFYCTVKPSRPEHYLALTAARAYEARREEQSRREWAEIERKHNGNAQ